MVLEEYAATFGYWATISMMPFFICPLIVCWNIIKFGFSDFFPPNTFLDGLLRSILFYYHGKLLMSHDIMQQNLFGIAIQLIYLALYYHYLHDKRPFHAAALKSGAFIVITLLYAHWESPLLAPFRFGYILTCLNLSTLYYPFMGIKYIITCKTTYGVPYMLVFFGQVVTTLWLLFAISIHNYVLVWQMLLPFLLGAVQTMLYFIYPTVPPIYAEQRPDPSTANQSSTESVKSRRTRLEELRRRKREKGNHDEKQRYGCDFTAPSANQFEEKYSHKQNL